MGARSSFKPRARLPSGPDSVVSAWLRVDDAVRDGSGISLVPDMLNTNPAVQTESARKPSLELSANGLPCMRFATNDVLVWPITPQSSASNQAGWGLWVKPDDFAALQRIIRIATGTNAANGLKMSLSASTSQTWAFAWSSTGTGNKQLSGVTAATGWQFVTVEYDRNGAADAQRLVASANGVQLSGAFTGADDMSLGLFAATGNILIGNNNDGTASLPLNGLIGPNIYAFSGKMSGAEFGVLTTAARNALMNFEAPT